MSIFHWHTTQSITTPLRIYISLSFANYFTIINPQNIQWGWVGKGRRNRLSNRRFQARNGLDKPTKELF